MIPKIRNLVIRSSRFYKFVIYQIWNTYLARRNREAGSLPRPCIMEKYWPVDKKECKSLKIVSDFQLRTKFNNL